jgi:ABC-type branched-subunit amino acid transport system substrate-binding protein
MGMAEGRHARQAGIWAIIRRGTRRGALLGVLVLAGCQVVPKAEKPIPVPPPVAPPVVENGLPTDAQRHRVALLVPLTGANAAVGRSIANATTMALLDTRTEKVRITSYDTGTGAAAAAQRAIADGNRLILGPLTAEDVRAVAPVARKAGVPIISFSNDAAVAGNGVYLLGYAPEQSIRRIVSYARGKGMNRFAALVPRGAYGDRAGGALLRAVEAGGGTVVGMQTFDRSAGSIAAAVRQLGQTSDYDALLIADAGRIALQAAPLVRKSPHGATARLLGTELWNTDAAIADSPALRGAWYASVSDALYRQLATKYRASYRAGPYRIASLGYDSVLLTARIAQDWKVGTPFPTARLGDKEGFAGIDGAFRFDSSGVADRALEVQQVGAGTIEVVDPAPRGFGG